MSDKEPSKNSLKHLFTTSSSSRYRPNAGFNYLFEWTASINKVRFLELLKI